MKNYLLLRDNKKSGPYDLQQLIGIGFKPYDLVWVEGKSAAWRYPGELDELKAYAPVVEEQPFDRFFKKKKVTKEGEPAQAVELSATYESGPGQTGPDPVRSVFVSLPSGRKKRSTPEPVMISESLPLNINQTGNPVDPPRSEDDANRHMEELKDAYTKTLDRRKKMIRRRELLSSSFRNAAAIGFVALVGILIYFTVRPKKAQPPVVNHPEHIEKKTPEESASPAENQDRSSLVNDQDLPGGNREGREAESKTDEKRPVTKTVMPEKINKRLVKKNEEVKEPGTTALAETPPSAALNEGNRRISKTREEGPSTAPEKRPPGLGSLVDLHANAYKRKAFGGIQNLELKVENRSGYVLDHVEVRLEYLKPSEQVLKSETIHFNHIAPHGSMTIKIPDSQRGIKVVYQISNIESSAYDKDIAGL